MRRRKTEARSRPHARTRPRGRGCGRSRASTRSGRGRRPRRAGAASGTPFRRRRPACAPAAASRGLGSAHRPPRGIPAARGRRAGRRRATSRRTRARAGRSRPSRGPRVRAVELPLESVPNFSEGRDRGTIEAIEAALAAHADVLDIHADADHNRSVFTLAGSERELSDALLAGVARAKERIDLRRHEGAHPRIGAADVVPIVPLRPADMERAKRAALNLAERIGAELSLPVFLYGELARGRGPAFFRSEGLEGLRRRVDSGELEPAFGPKRLDER